MYTPKPVTVQIIQESANEWLPYLVDDFSGGLNSADSKATLRKNQFSALLNYYIQPNCTLKTRGPYRPWLVTSEDTVLPDTAPPLTFTIVELRGSNFRVACWNNGSTYEVSVYDEANDRWAGEGGGTTIKGSGLTSGYKVRFAKFSVNEAEDLLFCNGRNTPQRWVGTVDTAASKLGLTVPSFDGAETAAEDNTLGASDRGITKSGVYTYKFTYFYDDSGTSTKYGESGPSATLTSAALDNASTSNPVACDLNLDLTGSALPTGVSECRVYRSPPDRAEGPFEYVGYFTSGDTYKDNCPNGEEGAEVSSGAGTPPKLKNIIVFDGRVWGIGQNSSGALTNKGVWSNRNAPDYYAAESFYYFPDPLIGPKAFNKQVYWFTEQAVYVTTDNDDPANNINKVSDIGCDSYDSIIDVGNGLVWQYQGNIYWANFNNFNPTTGELPWPIGDPIRDRIGDIPTSYRSNSAGAFYKDRYYLSFTGPNQSVNTSTVVWDVTHGTRFLLNGGQTGGWTSLDWAGNDLHVFDDVLYSADNTNCYIMEHDWAGVIDYKTKTEYDATTSYNIASNITTGIIHFGHEWAKKLINSLSIMTQTSTVTLTATISCDSGDIVRSKSFSLGSDTFAANSDWLIWGQGTWGNFKWASEIYGFQSDHQKIPKGAKCRNAKLSIESNDSQNTELLAFNLYHKILPIPA